MQMDIQRRYYMVAEDPLLREAPMGTVNLDWTDEKLLKVFGDALVRGDSAKEIAEHVRREIKGCSVTRNAVLGAVQRAHVVTRLKRLFPEAQVTAAINCMQSRGSNGQSSVTLRRF